MGAPIGAIANMTGREETVLLHEDGIGDLGDIALWTVLSPAVAIAAIAPADLNRCHGESHDFCRAKIEKRERAVGILLQ